MALALVNIEATRRTFCTFVFIAMSDGSILERLTHATQARVRVGAAPSLQKAPISKLVLLTQFLAHQAFWKQFIARTLAISTKNNFFCY